MKVLNLTIIILAGSAMVCCGLTNYVGGYSPGVGEDWLPASWNNFSNQLQKLTSPGDELRISGTITRETGTGIYLLTNLTHGIKITGGWYSPGENQPWVRLDLTDTNNFSVIDANQISEHLYIGGTNVLIEGIHFRRGLPRAEHSALGGVILAGSNGSIIDYCRFSDCGSSCGAGYGAALFIIASTNVTVRRSSFYNNFGVTNSANGSTCHLYIRLPSHNIRITQCVFERTAPFSAAFYSVTLDQEPWTPTGTNTVIFDNCLFYDNAKSIACGYGSNVFINTTIYNCALRFSDYATARTYFNNCIIDNTSYITNDNPPWSGAKIYFNNSCVTNLAWLGSNPFKDFTIYTNNCIDITTDNPVKFISILQKNFRLVTDSPAVDLGSDTYLAETYQGRILGLPINQQTDLDGKGRRKRNRVDAGCYENQPPSGTVIFFQ